MKALFFWEMVAAIAFTSLVVLLVAIGATYIMRKVREMVHASKKNRSALTISKAQAEEGSSTRSDLMLRFTEATESANFKMRTSYATHIADYVTNRLQNAFKVEIASSICNINSSYCSTVYKIQDTFGNIMFLALSWGEADIKDNNGRPIYTSKQNLLDYAFTTEDDDSAVFFGNSVEFIYPATLSDDHESIQEILSCLSAAEVERVTYNDNNPNSIKIFNLDYYHNQGFSLGHSAQVIRPMNSRMLDLSYGAIKYEFGGKTHEIPVSKAFPVMLESLKLGENVLIYGRMGTGKSTLADQLKVRLAADKAVKIITMTPAQFAELRDSSAQTALANALDADEKNIIFIDEAEALLAKGSEDVHTINSSLLLQMMSGTLQKTLNCQLVLSFNADPKDLDIALFRKGRAGVMIELTPIPRLKADALIEEIKHANLDRVFDKNKYAQILTTVNKAVDGSVYADVNEITLADMYDCFPHKSKFAALANALGKALGQKIEEPEVKNTKIKEIPKGNVPRLKPVDPSPSEARAPISKVGRMPVKAKPSYQGYKGKRK